METLIAYAQIAVSAALIALVLMQHNSAGASGIFGAGGLGFQTKRRGAEKVIFITTIVLAVIFVGLALLNLALPIS